jgi:hypothetical protein
LKQVPELPTLVKMPTKRLLFAYLKLLRVDMNVAMLEDSLSKFLSVIVTVDLKEYSHFHKVYQVILT